RITARRFTQDPRWGNLAGQRNPDFLNAALFEEAVLGPYHRAFSDHAGPFVFEFQAMRGKDLPEATRWAEELDAFLKELPRDFRYAVELRNAELLTDVHGAVLARHGVAHVFNSWNEMPGIGEQLELPWTFPAGFTVARGLLRPGRRYADAVKLFEPYEPIRDPQPERRHDLLRLVPHALPRRSAALTLVHHRRAAREMSISPNGLRNFLNGSAPRSATRAKLERWLADQGRTSRPPNVGQLVRLLNELSGDLAPHQTGQLGRDIARLLAEAYETRRLAPPRWVQDLVRQYRSARSKSAGEVA